MFFQRVLTRTLIEAKKAYPNLVYTQLHSFYRKFDPVRGMDYQMHLMFSDKHERTENFVMKRYFCLPILIRNFEMSENVCFSFEAVKPLGHVEIVPSPYVTESTRVALLLPTFEHQTKEATEFIAHYEKTCMEHQDNTFLMLVNSEHSSRPNFQS